MQYNTKLQDVLQVFYNMPLYYTVLWQYYLCSRKDPIKMDIVWCTATCVPGTILNFRENVLQQASTLNTGSCKCNQNVSSNLISWQLNLGTEQFSLQRISPQSPLYVTQPGTNMVTLICQDQRSWSTATVKINGPGGGKRGCEGLTVVSEKLLGLEPTHRGPMWNISMHRKEVTLSSRSLMEQCSFFLSNLTPSELQALRSPHMLCVRVCVRVRIA